MTDSVIETLANLQAIDRRDRQRLLEIAELERVSAELGSEFETKRSQVEAVRAESNSTGIRRRELEALLQDEERRLKERRMRLTRIRNEKEMDAGRREIDGLKESSSRHEEELLTLLEQSEAVDGGLRAAEEELQQVEARLRQHQQQADGRIVVLRAEIEAERQERERVASLLAVPMRKRYEQIFAKRGGLAVVEVRNGNCQGCKMSLPHQLTNELRRGERVITCPSCARILYWPLQTEAAASAEDA